MVESILRNAGYWTGLYTSPHLHSYTERIRINGESLSPDGFVRLTATLKRAVEAVQPALGERAFVTFDLLTALGFLAFREADVQVQIVEVGLGGRVDSTNVFDTKDVAVITPISLEHTQILGDTPGKIAAEKAGIITPVAIVVMSPQPFDDAARVIRERAATTGAVIIDVAAEFSWQKVKSHGRKGQDIQITGRAGPVATRLPLLGAHQIENAATAIATMEALRACGALFPQESVETGLSVVRWPGRFEILSEAPLLIVDGAHNRDSARRFRETLHDYFSCRSAFFIVGASADKDIDSIAEEITPIAREVFAVRADHPRAMDPQMIADAFERHGVSTLVVDNADVAIDQLLARCEGNDVICVLGSLFVAAEAREHMGLARKELL
jgi:dihydrofolate synthase/folylpolyglutamate synthase